MNDANGLLTDQVKGYAPLNLDECQNITGDLDPAKARIVLGDVILCEVIDEVDEGYVERNGIIIKENMGTKTWRKAKVIKTGRLCQDVKEGDIVVYPSDRGIRMVGTSKKRYIFLNESRIFYVE
jgi:co-chaperonin GroES (HSP10)